MKKSWSTHAILCIYFLYFFTSKMVEAQSIPIKVGVVLEMDDYGDMAFSCISMAISDFYSKHDHYKTRLDLITRDPKGDVVGAAAAGNALIHPTYIILSSIIFVNHIQLCNIHRNITKLMIWTNDLCMGAHIFTCNMYTIMLTLHVKCLIWIDRYYFCSSKNRFG